MFRFILPLALTVGVALSGCNIYIPYADGDDDDTIPDDPIVTDADGDGYIDMDDCDDNDASIHPGADEICDYVDNDCNGVIDDDLQFEVYPDADNDGYGDASASALGESEWTCEDLNGYVDNDLDCDDGDAQMHPDASEVCDNVDNDCNGLVDDGQFWYLDYDGDTYGDSAYLYEDGCDGSSYLVANDEDCDDSDASINPGADEICDGLDNDCSGTVDEDATDAITWYIDYDGDGYGITDVTMDSCDQPSGYAAIVGDCDDGNWEINPDASEVCDNVDNDCDGSVDEDVELTWYRDSDGDGYGDVDSTDMACDAPSGYVGDATDCDDANASANPGATEVCDSVDNDCDGDVDEDASDATTWYADADSDGYGDDDVSQVICTQPSGYVADNTDCDDTEPAAFPGNTEVCDEIDNDCDGSVDVGASDAQIYYPDADGDGEGNAGGVTVTQCDQPEGYVLSDDDCDDSDADVNTSATEVCDGGIDNNCDGLADDDPSSGVDTSTYTSFFNDVDGDGYGNDATQVDQCDQPSGTVEAGGDCDDTNSSVNPDGTESCNNMDDDCDGTVDEDVQSEFYADTDGDGYGDASSTDMACSAPSGYVANDTDCNDSDVTIYPGADEYCDTVDNDCDSEIDEDDAVDADTWYADMDSDGYGDASDTVQACSQPTGYDGGGDDCDDTDASVYPGADEYCDGADNDCDSEIDEDDAVDAMDWWIDTDNDGFGDMYAAIEVACDQPSGYVDNADDCDDDDNDNYVGATEVCDDSEDNDCDGDVDEIDECEDDLDGDGFVESEDCDDDDEYANPDGVELCDDGVDNDCDGLTDSADSCYYEGTYEGSFEIDLTETGLGLGSDVCEGTMTIVIDPTVIPVIYGNGECAFVGDFAYVLPDTYTIDLDGSFIDSDLSSEGTAETPDFGWSLAWSNTWASETEFDLNFSGSDTFMGFDFDYVITMETDLQ